MPREVHARAPIALPIEVCWQKLRDLTRAVHYVPGLSECRITTDAKEGVGASRRVVSRQAGAMDETVIDWREGRGFTLRLHKGDRPPMPFRAAEFRYELAPEEGRCAIETRMRYEPAFGVFGRLLDKLVLSRVMQRSVEDVARGLAAYYENDEGGGSPR